MIDPIVHFYVPSADLVRSVPETADEYWGWIRKEIQHSPARIPDNEKLCTWMGPYTWTIQTFMHVRALDLSCDITCTFPDEGIIVAHSDFLPSSAKPTTRRFIVEIKPDRHLKCMFTNFVIVQNRRDSLHKWMVRLFVPSAFVHCWPQPGLIPRDHSRGDKFENIRFFGSRHQFLHDEDKLRSNIEELGLRWKVVPRDEWHDYSETDAVVAVRQPMRKSKRKRYISDDVKPAHKLYNAWMAGVPAILSPDSAFRDIKRSELDYLEAANVSEVMRELKRLMRDPSLRKSMRENGMKRAQDYRAETITGDWIQIFHDEIIPEYVRWCSSSLRRRWSFFARRMLFKMAPSFQRRPMLRVALESEPDQEIALPF